MLVEGGFLRFCLVRDEIPICSETRVCKFRIVPPTYKNNN